MTKSNFIADPMGSIFPFQGPEQRSIEILGPGDLSIYPHTELTFFVDKNNKRSLYAFISEELKKAEDDYIIKGFTCPYIEIEKYSSWATKVEIRRVGKIIIQPKEQGQTISPEDIRALLKKNLGLEGFLDSNSSSLFYEKLLHKTFRYLQRNPFSDSYPPTYDDKMMTQRIYDKVELKMEV